MICARERDITDMHDIFPFSLQRMNVLVDTGSSNFAVAGRWNSDVDFYFDRSKSTTLLDLGRSVRLKYTQVSWFRDGEMSAKFIYRPKPIQESKEGSRLSIDLSLNSFQGEWEGDLVSDVVSLPSVSSGTRAPFTLITHSSNFFLKHAKWQG